MSRRSIVSFLIAALILCLVAFAAPTQAAFPGANGKIAFERACDIYTMNADGTAQTPLATNDAETSSTCYSEPAWSPDGAKLLFTREQFGPDPSEDPSTVDIYAVNANGTGKTNLTNMPPGSGVRSPAWSPDGQRIVFGGLGVMNADGTERRSLGVSGLSPVWSPDGSQIAFERFTNPTDHWEIFAVNRDGTGEQRLTTRTGWDLNPDWSPTGAKIALSRSLVDPPCGPCDGEIFAMNPDGLGATRITHDDSNADLYDPAWSPDGSKIAFFRNVFPPCPPCGPHLTGLSVVNADGTNQIDLTVPAADRSPTWQPFPGSSPPPTYEAPKLASPLRFSLVPVFKQCGTTANPTDGQHSAPLSIAACLPPAPQGVARFGPQSSGSAWIAVIYGDTNAANGDQADLTLRFDLSDIRTAAGADYNPSASGADGTFVIQLRITDRANNGPSGTSPGTTTNFDFAAPFNCTPTPDPALGSTCSLDTSADALNPGMIKENKASVIQVYRLRLNDSGPNGTRGDSDDRLFATEGVYVP